MFGTAKKVGALLMLLQSINGKLKKIEKKLDNYKRYTKERGEASKKLDKVIAKLDKALNQKRRRQ